MVVSSCCYLTAPTLMVLRLIATVVVDWGSLSPDINTGGVFSGLLGKRLQ